MKQKCMLVVCTIFGILVVYISTHVLTFFYLLEITIKERFLYNNYNILANCICSALLSTEDSNNWNKLYTSQSVLVDAFLTLGYLSMIAVLKMNTSHNILANAFLMSSYLLKIAIWLPFIYHVYVGWSLFT